jgi:hypothetical protein
MNVRHNVGCRIPNLETNLSSIIYYRDTSNTLKCLLNNGVSIVKKKLSNSQTLRQSFTAIKSNRGYRVYPHYKRSHFSLFHICRREKHNYKKKVVRILSIKDKVIKWFRLNSYETGDFGCTDMLDNNSSRML